MDAAKNAIRSIVGRDGHHDTEVHETVNPAVQNETVKPHQHEQVTKAVDREIHQDHHHTTVQPVADREVRPEAHTHNQLPTQEAGFVHGDNDRVQRDVAAETAQFKNTSTTTPTTYSAARAPEAVGEHVHHHVHENVQPIVNKETIQPQVVHTTKPVHEVHQAPSEHHGMSVLPTRNIEDFKATGGSLAGTAASHESYQGDPRPYNPNLQTERHDVDRNFQAHDGTHGLSDRGSHGTGALGGSAVTSGLSSQSSASGLTGSSSTRTAEPNQLGSDTHTTGTALGGRTDGNTAKTALEAAKAATGHHTQGHHTQGHHNTGRSNIGQTATAQSDVGNAATHNTSSGSDLTGGISNASTDYANHHTSYPEPNTQAHQSGTRTETDHKTSYNASGNRGADSSHARFDGGYQEPSSQPRDPAVLGTSEKGNLTGTGSDGSHSAVFGLTPDGHTYEDTAHRTGQLKPAHSTSVNNTGDMSRKSSVANPAGDPGNTDARTNVGRGVAEQLDDPRVAQKGHSGGAVESTSTTLPGAGDILPGKGV